MNNRGPHAENSVADGRAWTKYLLAIMAACVLLRVAGIGWGLPPVLPGVVASGLRCSYALDEDDVLSGAARTRLGPGFDPGVYHWGTLHFQITLAALEAAEALGAFDHTWRKAYYDMIPREFERVYLFGRLVTVLIAAAGLVPVFLLGLQLGHPRIGLFAAALVAVSPGHLLNSDQVRVDVTMAALTALTAWLALRAIRERGESVRWLVLGSSAGLAVAAKYSAALTVATLAAVALGYVRFRWRPALLVIGGAMAGFVIGEPGIVTHRAEIVRQVTTLVESARNTPANLMIPAPELFARHLLALARYSLGWPALLLAGWGCYLLLRRRSASDWMIFAALLAGAVSFIPERWVLLRYQLPFTPFVALAAGIALERIPRRWRTPATVATLAIPLFGALAALDYMRHPHPANQALEFILKTVPPQPIARLVREIPPLNPSDYPMGPNPFLDDLARNPPRWVLTSNLPDTGYPRETVSLLRERYHQVAAFETRSVFSWATLGERGAPHDWKYTHPRMVLYRRVNP